MKLLNYFLLKQYSTEPKYGKWSIKATQTWEWILHWEFFCEYMGPLFTTNTEVKDLIGSLVKVYTCCCFENLMIIQIFRLLWCWNISDNPEAEQIFLWFEANVSSFIQGWKKYVSNGKNRNYYHWLEFEAVKQIRSHGSTWRYIKVIWVDV